MLSIDISKKGGYFKIRNIIQLSLIVISPLTIVGITGCWSQLTLCLIETTNPEYLEVTG